MAEASAARFNRFSRGGIVGQAEAGVPRDRIRRSALKQDGTPASLRAIDAVIAKARAEPAWEGLDSSAGGRPRELHADEVQGLKDLIHAEVGLARVTIPYCRKRLA